MRCGAEEQRRRDLEVAMAMEARRRMAEDEAPMLEARGLLSPEEHSAEERERYNLTACWCLHCLRGKSQARGHYHVNSEKYGDGPPPV